MYIESAVLLVSPVYTSAFWMKHVGPKITVSCIALAIRLRLYGDRHAHEISIPNVLTYFK